MAMHKVTSLSTAFHINLNKRIVGFQRVSPLNDSFIPGG